jgi:lysophospholipase L1-like esterase
MNDKLFGKTIIWNGDSICAGKHFDDSKEDDGWAGRIAKRHSMTYKNYAIGGGTIADNVSRGENKYHTVSGTLDTMKAEFPVADYVIIEGGTNDADMFDVELATPERKGSFSPDDFSGNYDRNTFCGGLYLLLDALIEKYGKEKLCFLLPLHRFNEEPQACKGENADELGAPLSEYIECMRKILSEYGIEYIDLYENGFAKPLIDTGDEYTADGLHPNDNGYEFLANIVCDHLRGK